MIKISTRPVFGNAQDLKLVNAKAKSYLYMPKNPIVKEIELK